MNSEFTMEIDDGYFMFYRNGYEIYGVNISLYIANSEYWERQVGEKSWSTSAMLYEMRQHALTLR